jgi:hypothetical protein
MIGPRYVVPLLCGLLIAGVGPAEARGGGGGGHAASQNTSYSSGPSRHIHQARQKIPRAYVQSSRAHVQGTWASWGFLFQGSRVYRPALTAGRFSRTSGSSRWTSHRDVPGEPDNPYSPTSPDPAGGQGATTPMATSYASAPQFQYSCTINANQPEAGGQCMIISPTRRYSGGRCSCRRQWGTID